jgi:hypothetical protein
MILSVFVGGREGSEGSADAFGHRRPEEGSPLKVNQINQFEIWQKIKKGKW